MLKTLRFVRGAVAEKDLVPVLTHFRVYDGRIQGGNGRLSIDASCLDLKGLDITVPAERFLKAVDGCNGEPKLKITKTSKLSISHKKFKAILPLGDNESFPMNERSKGMVIVSTKTREALLGMLRALRPFIGVDASRPWACGILLKDGFAYATNNVILCRVPIPWKIDSINLPSFAVDELLRIGEIPSCLWIDDTSITFEYEDAWLKSQLFDLEWPDIEKFFAAQTTKKVSPLLFESIQRIIPFCPDPKFPVIKFSEEGVSTADGDMMAEVKGIKLPDAIFRAEPLLAVLSVATHIDFSTYPAPSPWKGENGLEGIFIGVKI